MRVRTVVLALCFLAPLHAVAEDCADCTASTLCATHAASHKAAGRALVEATRDGDAGKRLEAVLAFGRACASHQNCRPLTYLDQLGYFLQDQSLEVVAAAARTIAETQHPQRSGMLVGAAAQKLRKAIEESGADQAAERETRLRRLEAIVEGFLPAGEHAAPMVAGLLGSGEIDILEIASVRCRRTRGASMPKAVLTAIERCRTMPASEKRDQVCQDLVISWEELTKSGLKSPISDARDPAEMDRWIREAGEWVRKYLRTWK